LKNPDDVELLVSVLEANRPFSKKADWLATEILTVTQVSLDTVSAAAPSLLESNAPTA
jgi:hypothetical protein